ncbi:hypothetical protein ACTXT7_000016 [Hymenolepis weldensis]
MYLHVARDVISNTLCLYEHLDKESYNTFLEKEEFSHNEKILNPREKEEVIKRPDSFMNNSTESLYNGIYLSETKINRSKSQCDKLEWGKRPGPLRKVIDLLLAARGTEMSRSGMINYSITSAGKGIKRSIIQRK